MTLNLSPDLPQFDDYRSLFLNNTPLLDVRAPVEFDQGAFPIVQNLPLMNDQERTEIGIQYKELGQDEAIKLGQQLISGTTKSERIEQWVHFIKQYPTGLLYCFRGGMRSKISQQWIYEATGILYPRITGGYKAMRRFLISELDESSQRIEPIILSGRTGIGKTIFLKGIKQKIDLEEIYHHRGSVFGKHVTAQPSQINIENTLSIQLLQFLHQGHTKLVLEDEGNNIGSRNLPKSLVNKMRHSPVVVLEASVDERINITFQEYIIEALAEHKLHLGDEQGILSWSKQLLDSIDTIQRRLGGVRHKQLKSLMTNAIQQHLTGDFELHKDWIKILLVDYYDPMYDYQLGKKQDRVIFKGNKNEVRDYLTSESKIK